MKNVSLFQKVLGISLSLTFSFVLAHAQQLPDSGFEDWSGTQFASNAQPKYWNFSNVSQMGVERNFAHQATGRSGSGKALLIQNQYVGAMGIGATSPGYVALGQPWAYVAGLTSINDATAGTYGGINWTYRPDSMVVWIKRVYDSSVEEPAGDHTGDENFNLVYYAWTGTSKASAYKAKNGTCTTLPSDKSAYTVDEESDIRIALDYNECGTTTPGTQIAEGWYREMANYSSWTKITVPIFYLSDQAPAKCNVILSAGNYPNFRANTGINAGNSLYVDDISLIYSSKVQKLFVNGREWKGFDPDNTGEQTYSLGQGATVIPDIYAVRGAGSLTNLRGTKATFTGRRLSASECQINTSSASVDGEPVVITVNAEDGSSSTTYRIKFVSQASDNARLSDIRVNGATVSGFNAFLNTYNVSLPYGTTAVPVVAADPQDAGAQVTITQPTSVTGTATIAVTAQDGTHTQTYTLNFSVAQLSDNTLQSLMVNGDPIAGFTPAKANYTVELPLGTTQAPTITWTSAYPNGAQTIKVTSNTLDAAAGNGSATITVSVPGNAVTKTYRLTYKITASSYSKLADLKVGGQTLEGFSADNLNYYYNLPLGTTTLPAITYTAGDKYQTISVDKSNLSGLDGVVRVVVTAANGDQTNYRITFSLEKSSVNTLQMIYLNGVELEGFDANTNVYNVNLPIGTSAAPAITWTAGDQYQTISKTDGGLSGATRISVTAQSGASRIYQISFSVASSSDATLSMIYLDGTPLAGFSPAQLEYDVALPQGVASLPVVSFDPHDAYQTINARPCSGLNGDYKIIVKPQTGAAQTYVLHFSVATSSNNALAAIMLDGTPMAAFHADTLHYIDTLPQGVSTLPTITFTKGDAAQKVTTSVEGSTVTLNVRAESGAVRTYVLDFIIRKSENAFLQMIFLGGDSLADFLPQTLNYTVMLPAEATASPLLTVSKSAGQRVTISQPAFLGVAQIVVTPEQGAANIYRITFANASSVVPAEPEEVAPVAASANDTLAAIYLDGVLLSGFNPTTYTYDNIARVSAASLPTVSYTKGNDKQVVAMAQSSLDSISLIVMAESGHQSVYSLRFAYQPSADATLSALSLDGTPLAGFAADTYTYSVNLPAGAALPVLSFEAANCAQSTVSSTANSQTIEVYAEDGVGHHTYTINYTIPLRQNANLSSITLDDVALAGFAPSTTSYDYQLAWHATALPVIAVEAETVVSSIQVNYGGLSGATTIVVTAEDGVTQKTYTITFSSPLSDNAKAADIMVDGADYVFSPDQLTYDINLPYGTSSTPEFTVEKALPQQQVVVSRGSIGQPSTVTITAEDGTTQLTYTYHFSVAQTTLPNVLNSIVLDGIGALDMAAGPDFAITLPYGTTSLDIVSITKNFPEQSVVIADGGVTEPTTITVKAAGKTDKVYTITPSLMPNPLRLTSIMVNGTALANFDPDQLNYVLQVTSAPTITYTVPGASYSVDVDKTISRWQGTVEDEDGTNKRTYTLFFHYTNDVIPNGEFENWTTASVRTDAKKPTDWHVASDYTNKKYLGTARYGDEVSQDGSNSVVKMVTSYWMATVCGLPSTLTLGALSPTIGTGGGNCTNPFSGGISFRNSPDTAIVKYYYKTKKGNGALFAFRFFDENGVEYSYDWTATASTSSYQVHSIPLGADTVGPAKMNIAINPTGQTASTATGAELYVDYVRFAYSSALAGIKVDGANATQSGTTFTYDLSNADYVGLPSLKCVGAATDQAARVTWTSDWAPLSPAPSRAPMRATEEAAATSMQRAATIRNYAEDGTYTDYLLLIRRPISSTDTCSFSLNGTDLTISKGSPFQTITVTKGDSAYAIRVQAESGVERTYQARFLFPTIAVVDTVAAVPFAASVTPSTDDQTPTYTPSSEVALAGILLNGVALSDFSPLIDAYTVQADVNMVVEPVKAESAQQVQVTRFGLDFTLTVTAEDGVSTAAYTLHGQPVRSSDAQLAMIRLNGVDYASFNPATLDYEIVLPCASPKMAQPLMPSVEFVAADSLQSIAVELAPLGGTTYATVTAADGNQQAQYALHFVAQQSSFSALSDIRVNGTSVAGFAPAQLAYTVALSSAQAVVTYTAGDAFQTISESRSGWVNNICRDTLTVTAEDGAVSSYVLTLTAPAASTDASLSGLYVDGALVSGFSASQLAYSVTLPQGTTVLPDVSGRLADDGAAITFSAAGDDVSLTITAEDGLTRQTYTIHFDIIRSSEAHLSGITLDESPLAGFAPDQFTYQVNLPVGVRTLPDVAYTKQEETERVDLTAADRLHTLTVTAEDGTVLTYTIQYAYTLSTVDTLSMIYEDGAELASFQAAELVYNLDLPVGTRSFPQLSYELGDAYQTVTVDTLSADEWQQAVRFTATSESGLQRTYQVTYTILRSTVDTLQLIYLDNQPMAAFEGTTDTYRLTLPYGTTTLPEVGFVNGDAYQTVDSVWAADSLTIRVTAENGGVRTYVLSFTIARSNNAALDMIALDGANLNGFDALVLAYNRVLPYGTTEWPAVSWTAGDEQQTVDTVWTDNSVTLHVTAGDGLAATDYVISFSLARSTNADLKMLFLDGDSLSGFMSDDFEYSITLPYGAEQPAVTWTAGDEQQTVSLQPTADGWLITVTAGDGENTNEYSLTFVRSLSPNNYLTSITLDGKALEGFHRDSAEYHLSYPVGTPESELLTAADVLTLTADSAATVVVTEEQGHTLTIMVTAPNGDIRVYVIYQSILLSTEARLQMIYLDSVALKGFSPDTLFYTVILSPGANMPNVDAATVDTLAEVEMGSFVEVEEDDYTGKSIEIDGVAQDGSRITYTVLFRYANWSATADVDPNNYVFCHVKGSSQYMAVTISVGIQLAIYDLNGRRVFFGEVPVANPEDVQVETDAATGDQSISEVNPGAEGLVFDVPNAGQTYFYVFFDSKGKRVAKGGKFCLGR